MSVFKGFKNLLVLSPHPDDSEYSCAGMIENCNSKVTIQLCSSGGQGDYTNKEDRVKEVKDFWKERKNVFFLETNLIAMDYHRGVKLQDQIFLGGNFDAIFVPPELDTNQEHRKVSKIIKSSLRNKPAALFEYQTPSTIHDWAPNIWLEIDEAIKQKKKNLKSSFKSQKDKSYFQEDYLDLFHRDWQAKKRGINYCEKYKLISWICK